MIGKKVIIRSEEAGVFYGTLEEKNDTQTGIEVKLTNCRRIWYWEGATTLSQLSQEGTIVPEKCEFTMSVPEIVIEKVVEILPCSEKGIKSIEGVKVWKI
jgi:hypothetical protein